MAKVREIWSGEMLAKSAGRNVIVTRVYERESVTGNRLLFAALSEVAKPHVKTVVLAETLQAVEVEGEPVAAKPKRTRKPRKPKSEEAAE